MGKLEEFTATSPEFAKARRGIEALAHISRQGWRRYKWTGENVGCFRILTDPERELELWEKKGGYRVADSMWGRFVCTANKFLPWMMKQDLVPPWLKKPEIMIEVEESWDIKCLKYSQAALGVYPIRKDTCEPAHDVYVSNEDLVLSECWTYNDVPIKSIKRMWIAPDSPAKAKAEEFAKKYKIAIEYGFPEPSIDPEQEEFYKKNYPPKIAEEKIKEWRKVLREEREVPLLDLVKFLKERHEVCWDMLHPPRDVVAGALCEAYDKIMHRETPFGSSDAIATMIELGKKEPTLSPVWGLGQPKESCLTPTVGRQTIVV